jgi:hypothetical protein
LRPHVSSPPEQRHVRIVLGVISSVTRNRELLLRAAAR